MIDLSPNNLIAAYSHALFPMSEGEAHEQHFWVRPKLRGIIPLDSLKCPKRFAREFRNRTTRPIINRDFRQTLYDCREGRDVWISKHIINAYSRLHEMGYAHSLEVFDENQLLLGGLYGVSLKSAFFGESMFSKQKNGSKYALLYLMKHLKNAGFTLLDTQFYTNHLHQFGCIEISDEQYQKLLHSALEKDAYFSAYDIVHFNTHIS